MTTRVPYRFLADILDTCILRDPRPEPTVEERLAATMPLRLWIEENLQAAKTPISYSSEQILQKLRHSTRELLDLAETDPDREIAAGYLQISFIDHLLREPPTNIATLARTFEVDEADITQWLAPEAATDRIALVAEHLLRHLCDLCSEPEKPAPEIPPPPLESFDDLTYLGNLRQAFSSLYRNNPPKRPQAAYIPLILKALDGRFKNDVGGQSLVIAPTNGGKNGIILAAALAAVAWDKGPALVLQPYRAQIAESRRSWNDAVAGRPFFRPSTEETKGVRVAGSSSLISEYDRDILRGRIDVTAIIPEKLAVLSRERELKSFCKLLISDEIALLLDKQRGPKLEIMLTLAKEEEVGLIATGAGLPNGPAERVARWIGDLSEADDPRRAGTLIFDPDLRRDPPIEYWVVRKDGERRFWKTGADPSDLAEPDEPFPEEQEEAVAELVIREMLASPDRQILVFLEHRQRVVELADEIARRIREHSGGLSDRLPSLVSDSADGGALEEIWLGGSLPARVDVVRILKQRVGVHTRDVPSNNLERIEEAFRDGRLRVLCATTTVEAGINLPVDTVIQVGLLDHNQRKLSPRPLEQRLGRSGRTLKGREQAGKGIVYIHDSKQRIERVIQERILKQDESFDSQLDEDHQALLLLTYVGPRSEASTQDLTRLLSRSYWAFGRRADEISSAAKHALDLLRQHHLITNLEDSGTQGPYEARLWKATPLGQALASALISPKDSGSINMIVSIASRTPSDETWLPEVLFAASSVPSVLNKRRHPLYTDIVSKPPLDYRTVLGSWIHSDSSRPGTYLFGFPGRKNPKMRAGATLGQMLERIKDGRSAPQDATAVIRTYISWLWSTAAPIQVRRYVRALSEHIIRQDVAYYLSHVLRAASWLARYRFQYLLALRLKEVSQQVRLGVPIEAALFFEECHEQVRRDSLASVPNNELGLLLKDLEPRLKEDLTRRLDIRRARQHQRNLRLALDADAIENEDQKVRFDRIEAITDLRDLFLRVWDGGEADLEVVDESVLCVGECFVELTLDRLTEESRSESDLVISAGALPSKLRTSRRLLSVSMIGREELVVLVTQLADMSLSQQKVFLKTIIKIQRVCFCDLLENLHAELLIGEDFAEIRNLEVLTKEVEARMVRLLIARISPLFSPGSVPGLEQRALLSREDRRNMQDDEIRARASRLLALLRDELVEQEKVRVSILLDSSVDELSEMEIERERLVRSRGEAEQLLEDARIAPGEKLIGIISRAESIGRSALGILEWEQITRTVGD